MILRQGVTREGGIMSLKPKPPRPMPAGTARLGTTLLRPGSPYRLVGDELYAEYREEDFVDLYAVEGKPALSPVDLAFVTAFQFLENLSDREVIEALRLRVDFKYALHLPLDDEGFDASVLCEYRQRVIAHRAEARLFETVIKQLNARGLIKKRGRQRSDSLAILTRVRDLNRLERVVETLRLALCALLGADTEWTRTTVPPEWESVYGERCVAERLTEAQRQDLTRRVGSDGQWLLARLQDAGTPAALRKLEAVQVLATVWAQQFEIVEGQVVYREEGAHDGKTRIQTPHDPEARYSKKGAQQWIGDKLQVTETDDEDKPHLITDVSVTSSVETDHEALDGIQERLIEREVPPSEHYGDGGYVSEGNLARSAARGIDLLGPAPADQGRQARLTGGLTLDQFHLNREAGEVTCPAGQVRQCRVQRKDAWVFRFPKAVCLACPLHDRCCTGRGGRTVRFGTHYELLQAARKRQQTAEFKETYRQHRAGVEGCLSALVRGQGVRVARYTRRAKRHLFALFMAAGVNLRRAARWLAGIRPQAKRCGLKLAEAA